MDKKALMKLLQYLHAVLIQKEKKIIIRGDIKLIKVKSKNIKFENLKHENIFFFSLCLARFQFYYLKIP